MANGYDVIIVGGGLAGLTAAAFAAKGGARTLVLEGAGELGGRARTRDVNGFLFNHGPHALYLAAAGMRTLKTLGIDPPGGRPALAVAYTFKGKALHRLPLDFAGLLLTSALTVSEKMALMRAYPAMLSGKGARQGETMAEALSRLCPDPGARAVLEALTRVSSYIGDLAAADGEALMAQIALATQGVRYLDGGWATMVAALEHAARDAGAEIRTEARVDFVMKETRSWCVALGNGERLEAASVILALPPEDTAALAPGSRILRETAASVRPARATCLDIGLSRLPHPDRIFALGTEAPTYFSVHSKAAKLAPDGGAMIHVSRYLGADTPKPDARAELEGVLDLMQPGWRDVLVAQQFLPIATVMHDIPQAARGGLAGRCPVSLGDGLYAAGDWVGGEGLLSDAAFASGAQAGALAAKTKALAAT